MILQEQIRPKTLDDFIGNQRAIDSLHAYMKGNVDSKAALLISNPGLGKTTLAHCMARHYDYDPLEINGSDEKKKDDISRIIKARRNSSISFDYQIKKKLLILDEIEPITTPSLNKLINEKGKKILICNDQSKIHYTIRNECHQITLKEPTKQDYKRFIKERLNVTPPDDFSFKSWRDCINWYYGGDYRNTTMLTELQQAREIFTVGPQRDDYDIKPERLLEYYIHNAGDPSIVSLLNLKMQQTGILKKVVRDVLYSLRLPQVNSIRYYSGKSEPPQKQRKRVKFLGFLT